MKRTAKVMAKANAQKPMENPAANEITTIRTRVEVLEAELYLLKMAIVGRGPLNLPIGNKKQHEANLQ